MPSLSILNRLLPFATPGTPVLQDVLHLVAICALLYFAPQMQESLQARRSPVTDDAGQERPGVQQQYEDFDQRQGEQNDREPVGGVHDANDGEDEIEAVAHQEDILDDSGEEGQAGPARAPMVPEQRNVGAKKAKALARRDQRRAYHEFQRSQGEAQRARDAEGADERDKAQAAERERRRAAEATLEAKKAKEREERRAKEDAARAQEQRRREQTVELVQSRLNSDRMCDLFKVAREVGVDDEDWVEKIVKASGMLGRQNDTMTMITDVGWAVRVSAADMQMVYDKVLADDRASNAEGRIEPSHVVEVLENSLLAA